ncbi:MAG: GAF domain-containing protein [Alphaproteobacteria bacterium]|nr:GAF domain-containing protein [Alphaproteobacteria bacterium]
MSHTANGQDSAAGFPVVGIGASAGGINALQSLFKTIPAGTNLALVVVQHLLPDKPSQLAGLISRWTAMPVREAREGMALEPNCVFVAPPGLALSLENGVFVTQPLDSAAARLGIDVIDTFFESLANAMGPRAIAVVLSGTGADGAAGAVRVKQAGGMVLVQEPATAMHDGMPMAAIANGAADHVLSLGSIAHELAASAAPDYVRSQTARAWADDVTKALDGIITLIRTRAGFDLEGYKTTPLLWRIQRRMELRRVSLFRDYEALLHDDPAELETLIRGIPIHVTEFFRDAPAWEALARSVIPRLFEAPGEAPIRAWSAACATGEEAYSLAMLLAEHAATLEKPRDFQVFATDAAADVLARAARGIFKPAAVATLSPERRQGFFYAADGAFRVNRRLREKMVFAPQDLLADPPFAGVDLVTCRNLLIYLEPEAAQRVLYLLHSSLRPGGYLLLGRGEAVPAKLEGFRETAPGARIYCKAGEMPKMDGFPKRPLRFSSARSSRAVVDAVAHQAAAAKQDLPAVLIDEDFRIIRLYGDTAPILRFKPGEPTLDLLQLLPPAMAGCLETAAADIRARGRAAAISPLDFMTGERAFGMRVTPVEGSEDDGRLLISFPPNATALTGDADRLTPGTKTGDAMDWSEALRLSHEELEASREELQALNEELRASNDQLNIANEDLAAANTQLQGKIGELETQSNVLSSGEVMTLFLDEGLRVRWFTPAIAALFPLSPSDAGRRITDFAPTFDHPPFVADVRRVMATGEPGEAEIRSANGRWYLKRIRPFHAGAVAGAGAGVAITFTDISERKRAEEAEAEELRNTKILRDLGARLVTEENIQTIYEEILTAAIEITGAVAGTVQMLDAGAQELIVLAAQSFSASARQYFQRVDASSQTSCGLALQTGARAFFDFDPASTDPSVRKHVEEGVLSAQSSPLVSRSGQPIGMVSTHWRELGHRPSERELRFLDLLVRQAADLIEQRLAEERLKQSEAALASELRTMTRLHGLAERLLTISDLSTGLREVLDTAVEVFQGGRGTVQTLAPDGDSLVYAASRGFDAKMLAAVPPITRDFHSTCAACIRTGARVVASNIAADPLWAAHAATAAALGYGAAFSAPLKTRQNELLGVMTVHFDRPYTPSESELRWLDLFARSAAQLVERARAEAAMYKSEQRFQQFAQASSEIM